MQAQVQSRQVRLQSILENISDGIITIDEGGMIETFNSAAQKLFGYSYEEAYGQSVTLLMPETIRASHPVYLDNYKRNGIRHAIDREREEMARRKDGSLFPMSIKVKEMSLDGKRFFTAVVADISERKAAMERLREMAEKDALTGLHNRRYFLDELDRAVNRARRGGTPVTLLYIDLDNFKFVNDTMGHQAGDQVLIEVTEMLGVRVRSGDLFARLGGDEFAVLLYELDDATAMYVADSYRQLLADYKFKYDGKIVDIGCSIGIASYSEGVDNKEDLLARADLACHIAKSSGRNRSHLFDATSQEEVEGMSADMGWARRIKEAIEEDGFTLAYQPIMRSADGETHSYEALIRMYDKDGALISPAGFLPAAERFGLMVELDRWVIRHAIAALRSLQQRQPGLMLNINLSAPSVETPGILDTVREELALSGVAACSLVFEITETTAITKLAQAVELLEGLKALGCATALDDFGTGYSSFAYLKELPVDYVKIDGSFVQNLDCDRLNQVMVRSMHDVAHAMGKYSVAEFVETAEVMQTLRDIGVDYQQGYYLGKPELKIVF
jgi:diguanylate cyclase (GGDEF)-like protein/PAS domain S-box-containing protein